MQACVFIHCGNKARCTFLLQRGLAAQTQRFYQRREGLFYLGFEIEGWNTLEINGEGKHCPVRSLRLAVKRLTFEMCTTKMAQKASSTLSGGSKRCKKRGCQLWLSDERSIGVWPRVPLKQEPFITRELKVRLVFSGSTHQLASPFAPERRKLRSLEVHEASGARVEPLSWGGPKPCWCATLMRPDHDRGWAEDPQPSGT